MVSSEVQRTLVKSPPELWAEISDPESLARHLGEFGEIRITRVHPEQRVEWETDDARGTVAIKPSGWGTKVKLTVTRELHAPVEAAAPTAAQTLPATELDAEQAEGVLEVDGAEREAPPEVISASAPAPERESTPEPEPEPAAEAELTPEAEPEEPVDEPDPAAAQAGEAEQEPRRGFFARLFGRRRSPRTTAPGQLDEREAAEAPAEDDAQAEPPTRSGDAETIAGADDELQPPVEQTTAESAGELAIESALEPAQAMDVRDTAGQDATPLVLDDTTNDAAAIDDESGENAIEEAAADIAAEIRAAEEVAAEQVTAVLSGVLDRLGAAHHRPFSRS